MKARKINNRLEKKFNYFDIFNSSHSLVWKVNEKETHVSYNRLEWKKFTRNVTKKELLEFGWRLITESEAKEIHPNLFKTS